MLENRSKAKISELITPLIYQIESDREERARIEVFQDKILARLEKLEILSGSSKVLERPKFAETLDNKISDLKAQQLQDFQHLSGEVERNNMKCR